MELTKLYQALAAAQRDAHAVEKTSQNTFHRYSYASTEALITEARVALGKHGLALFPSSVTSATENGEETLHVIYVLAHESGEQIALSSSTPVVPEKGRPRDKAVATAKTYDLGYTLRSLLLLPRVEEGTDVDQRDDREHEPKKRASKAKTKKDEDGPGWSSYTERLQQWKESSPDLYAKVAHPLLREAADLRKNGRESEALQKLDATLRALVAAESVQSELGGEVMA